MEKSTPHYVPQAICLFQGLDKHLPKTLVQSELWLRNELSKAIKENGCSDSDYACLFNRTVDGIEQSTFPTYIVGYDSITAIGGEAMQFLMSNILTLLTYLKKHLNDPSLTVEIKSGQLDLRINRYPLLHMVRNAVITESAKKASDFKHMDEQSKKNLIEEFLLNRLHRQAKAFDITLPDNLILSVLDIQELTPVRFKKLNNGKYKYLLKVHATFQSNYRFIGAWRLSLLPSRNNGRVVQVGNNNYRTIGLSPNDCLAQLEKMDDQD